MSNRSKIIFRRLCCGPQFEALWTQLDLSFCMLSGSLIKLVQSLCSFEKQELKFLSDREQDSIVGKINWTCSFVQTKSGNVLKIQKFVRKSLQPKNSEKILVKTNLFGNSPEDLVKYWRQLNIKRSSPGFGQRWNLEIYKIQKNTQNFFSNYAGGKVVVKFLQAGFKLCIRAGAYVMQTSFYSFQ